MEKVKLKLIKQVHRFLLVLVLIFFSFQSFGFWMCVVS